MPPDKSKHVTKGGDVLAIPRRLSDRDLPIRVQRLSKKCHQTVEAKEERSRALNGLIRPLALRLDAQMGAPLLKRHFQTPALHEVADDLFCRLGRVSGKECFCRTLARWITRQNPPAGYGVRAITIPQRCSRTDLQSPLPFAVP